MNTIVAIPLDKELAETIGKPKAEGSIIHYNRKVDGNVIVGMAPASLDEKFYSLPETLLIANCVLLSTRSIDKSFGEVLVACSLLDKKIYFTKDNDISKLLANLPLKNVAYVDSTGILSALLSVHETQSNPETRIDIDAAFPVKGVGTVALGVVTKGRVSVHDTLYHSSGKAVTVRSIQSQDEDQKEAEIGTRVGLALKGIEAEEIEKGDILSKRQIKRSRRIVAKMNKSGFVNEQLQSGKAYGVADGFSFSTAFLDSQNGENASFRLEKQIAVDVGDTILLMREQSPRIFASGTIEEVAD